MDTFLKRLKNKQSCPPRAPITAILWSGLGAFFGILCVALIHAWWLGDDISTLYLVGSFGATAVLIYGAPRAEFSQPRNVLGGHVISALVGVSVYQLLPFDLSLVAAIAVSLAIMAMQLTRTVHPPGGATALISVIGSSDVHQLGYWFVLFPIGTGAVAMLVIALVINNLSKDPARHYPNCWF